MMSYHFSACFHIAVICSSIVVIRFGLYNYNETFHIGAMKRSVYLFWNFKRSYSGSKDIPYDLYLL